MREGAPPAGSPDNYAFVWNVGTLVGEESFTVAPGHVLRRANDTERTTLREILQGFLRARLLLPESLPIGTPWERTPDDKRQPLPEDEWRYFVIGFRGSNQTLLELEEAFNAAPLELEIALTVLTNVVAGARGISWNPQHLHHILDQASWITPSPLDATKEELQAVTDIYNRLRKHTRESPIRRLLGQLQDLKALPPRTPLLFLGYFAILEALLVHSPKPSDPYDTITRQIKKKIALLDHRWQPPLDYTPFRGAAPEKVWTKMYEYRSQLAHGGAPRLDDGDLRILRSHEDALRLVRSTVKATIRQALIEPQLLQDIREC